jgi:hypothetical protein
MNAQEVEPGPGPTRLTGQVAPLCRPGILHPFGNGHMQGGAIPRQTSTTPPFAAIVARPWAGQ